MYIIASVTFFIGLALLAYYRFASKAVVVLKRTKVLSLKKAKVDDDVWITGVVHAEQPVLTPHFAHESVSYNYSLFEKVSNFANETWTLVASDTKSTTFCLDDGSSKIAVDPTHALQKYFLTSSHETETQKHVLTYLPASGVISCAGVTSEDKTSLLAKGEVPLLITPVGRKQFFQKAEKQDLIFKLSGSSLMWLAMTMTTLNLLSGHVHGAFLYLGSFILGVWPFVIGYYFFVYNHLVNKRIDVFNSWAIVEKELNVRRNWIKSALARFEKRSPADYGQFALMNQYIEKLLIEKRLRGRVRMENELSQHLIKLREVLVKLDFQESSGESKQINHLLKIEQLISHANFNYTEVTSDYNSMVSNPLYNWIARRHFFEMAPYYGELQYKNHELAVDGRRSKIKHDERKTDHPLFQTPGTEIILNEELSSKNKKRSA